MKMTAKTVLTMMCLMLVAQAAPARTVDEERAAIKDYLKAIDRKIERFMVEGNKEKISKMQFEKEKTQARLDSLSAPERPSDKEEVSVEDLREEMNMAIAGLKEQLDKVKKDNSDAKVSGEIRFGWAFPGDNSTIKNNFDVTRAYLTVRKKLAWDASARITLDVSRLSATSASSGGTTTTTSVSPQRLFDYIKYAYVDMPIPVSEIMGTPFTMTAKMGLQHNMWIDWADKIWGHAYIMKQFTDNEGIMSSADFGLGATGKFTLFELPEVEYHATLLNGSGYSAVESNTEKDIALRLNSDLLKNETIGTVVLGSYINSKNGFANIGARNQKQIGMLIALVNDTYGNLYIEYLKGTNNNRSVSGLSIGGFVYPMPEFLPGVGLLARADNYDQNTVTTNDEKLKSVFGVFYNWGKDMKIALNWQSSQTGSGIATKTTNLSTVVNF